MRCVDTYAPENVGNTWYRKACTLHDGTGSADALPCQRLNEIYLCQT